MTWRYHLRDLVTDERGHLSSARVGLWTTVAVTLVVVGIDVVLTLHGAQARVPNTVYGVLGTMFMAFASWAAGPRIAQYLGPQIGQVASGLASASRDAIAQRRKEGAEWDAEST